MIFFLFFFCNKQHISQPPNLSPTVQELNYWANKHWHLFLAEFVMPVFKMTPHRLENAPSRDNKWHYESLQWNLILLVDEFSNLPTQVALNKEFSGVKLSMIHFVKSAWSFLTFTTHGLTNCLLSLLFFNIISRIETTNLYQINGKCLCGQQIFYIIL